MLIKIELSFMISFMVKGAELEEKEIPKRPSGFWHFGTSPFCEGESQTYKISLNGSIYSTNIHIRLYLYTEQKGACSEPRNKPRQAVKRSPATVRFQSLHCTAPHASCSTDLLSTGIGQLRTELLAPLGSTRALHL